MADDSGDRAAAARQRVGLPDFEWEDARIDVLDALGRTEDAQAARWGCFERALSSTHLRAYLRRLPDFDDVEAEKGPSTTPKGRATCFRLCHSLSRGQPRIGQRTLC